jgi:vacuolar-type H+-ATPase subunit H/HEPN domain-containing protein
VPDAAAGDLANLYARAKQQMDDISAYQNDPANKQQLGDATHEELSRIGSMQDAMKLTPHLQNLAPPPDTQMRHASAGMVIGSIIAGFVAGRALHAGSWETAAKTLGESMKNWREGEVDRINNNVQRYKYASEQIKTANENAKESIKDARETAKTNLTLAQMKADIIRAQYFDGLKLKQEQLGDTMKQLEAMDKLVDKHIKLNEQMDNHMVKVAEAGHYNAETRKTNLEAANLANGLPASGVKFPYEADPDLPGAIRPIPGSPADPTSPNYKPPAGGTNSKIGLRENQAISVINEAATTASLDLQNIVDVSASTGKVPGAFFTPSEKGGVSGAFSDYFGRSVLNDADQNAYQQYAASLARAMTALQSAGYYRGAQGSIDELHKAIEARAGLSEEDAYQTLANAKQGVVAGVKAALASPTYKKPGTEDSAALLKQLSAQVDQAVPYDNQQINEWRRTNRRVPFAKWWSEKYGNGQPALQPSAAQTPGSLDLTQFDR